MPALLVALLLSCGALGAQAEGGLRVGLVRPMEGETYYAGPTSVVYSIKIDGWVAGAADPRAVQVRVDILQGAQLHRTLTLNPDPDGTFLDSATVNPAGAHGDFGPVEIVTRCDECHYRAAIDLPNGAVTLRLTATTPDGQEARLERHIVVDRSSRLTVPVSVSIAGQPTQRVSGLPVSASTRLYMWRARHATAATDANGIAQVTIEAPSQTTTRYVFRVEPVVVDGVYYESAQPVEVELPRGATSVPPISLIVSARKASVSGTVSPRTDTPLSVRAIRLPDGAHHAAPVNADGTYAFGALPIGRYLLAVDAAPGWASEPRTVDLAENLTPQVALTLVRVAGETLRGSVRDDKGEPLPFAWLNLERAGALSRAAPATGEFAVAGVPPGAQTLIATAPGYYSQAQVVSAPGTVSLALTPRPETRRIVWGEGAVLIPPESDARVTGNAIQLVEGWVWGQGAGAEPLVISTETARVTIAGGHFALEQFNFIVGESPLYVGWLAMFEGEASVEFGTGRERVRVGAGEMLALTDKPPHSAVPYDAFVFDRMRAAQALPYTRVWEPSPEARLRDGLAQAGLTTAQAITFVTYLAVVLSLALIPLLGLLWFRRRQQRAAGKRMT